VYSIESIDGGSRPRGRFRRVARVEAPIVIELDRDVDLPMAVGSRSPGGLAVRATELGPYGDGSYRVVLEVTSGARTERIEITARAEASERRIGEHHLVRVAVSSSRDSLGCPRLRVALLEPRGQTVHAHLGESVRVRREETLVVGALHVRYLGWMEGAPVEGPGEAFASFEITSAGGEPTEEQCPIGASVEIAGHRVEAIQADYDEATLRVHPANATPR
jgi:hypothetical protein